MRCLYVFVDIEKSWIGNSNLDLGVELYYTNIKLPYFGVVMVGYKKREAFE